MTQFFLHMIGDYVTQNNYLANTKTENSLRGYVACLVHVILYSIPFLIIGSIQAVFIIMVTHFIIDKYRLAKYVIQLKNWCFTTQTGFPEGTPSFISIWILFIVDNIMHVSINYLALLYF